MNNTHTKKENAKIRLAGGTIICGWLVGDAVLYSDGVYRIFRNIDANGSFYSRYIHVNSIL